MAYKQNLDKEIVIFFDEYIANSKDISIYSELMLNELKSVCVRGGKRVRPSLAHYVYTLLGGTDIKNITMAEIALDINGTYILILDDVQDRSPLRRGAPTIHENVRNYALNNFENISGRDLVHLGHSQALNVCLFGCHIAQKIVIETGFEEKLKLQALLSLNEGNIITGHGQVLDIFGEITSTINEKDVIDIMKLKTAYYTFVNPLLFGATFAGADEETKDMLSTFGISAGIAFQIQDDILGMFGDEEKLGKPADSDLKEGKKTLLIKYALDAGSQTEKDIINSALGNDALTDEDIAEVRKIIIKTGALDKTKALAQKYINEAKVVFESGKKDSWDQQSYDYLIGLMQYMIERDL